MALRSTLEDALAVVVDGGNEEGAFGGSSCGIAHWGSLVASPAVVKRREARLRQRGDASAGVVEVAGAGLAKAAGLRNWLALC